MDKIKNLLPLGYLYLIILGILKESLLYNQLGINILKYSSIMDILISPISDIATNPFLLFIIFIIIALSLLANHYSTQESYKERIIKIFGIKDIDSNTTSDQLKILVQSKLIAILAFGLLFFFLGIGWGAGSAKVKRIESGDLKFNYALNLISGEQHDVYLIGSNTSYHFYVRKDDKKIYISPVTSIMSIALNHN